MAIYGYRRVSSVEQADPSHSSLDDQERRIRGAAMVRGEEVNEIFTDPGVSGSIPLFTRPAGGRLSSILVAGDTVIAAKMDRIFRSVQDAVNTADRLKKMGVNLILVDVGTDPITEGGVSKLFFSILAAVAEFERYRIAERNIEGRKSKKARGGFIGGDAPYGYKVYGKGSNATLVQNDAEMDAISTIVDLASIGSLRSVSRELASRGIRSRSGSPLHPTAIQRILKRAGQTT